MLFRAHRSPRTRLTAPALPHFPRSFYSFSPFPCRYYAREVQRVFRAHLSRKRVRRLLDRRYAALAAAPRHAAATAIQRHFRGYYSRKHLHNFYERKAYILTVAAKGEELRAAMDAAHAAQIARLQSDEEARAREEFDKTTQHLHHLVSTRAQPGVYNPPYAGSAEDVPSAFGVPLETHLRVGSLRYIRTHGLHPVNSGAAGAGGGGDDALTTGGTLAAMGERNVTLVPAYVQPDKRSLQATAPYDAPLLAARQEARYQKLQNLDQKPVKAGGKAHYIGAITPVGVNAATPYTEPWLIARNTRDLEHLVERHKRVTDRPYVPASSRASRLFEDTERKRVAVAAGLAGTVAGSGSAAATATAGASATARATASQLTSTVKVGNTVRRVQGPGSTARTEAGAGVDDSALFPQAGRGSAASTATDTSSLGDPTLAAYAAGSAAAAVRRARQAQVGVDLGPHPSYGRSRSGNNGTSSTSPPPAVPETAGTVNVATAKTTSTFARPSEGGVGSSGGAGVGARPSTLGSTVTNDSAGPDDYESKEDGDSPRVAPQGWPKASARQPPPAGKGGAGSGTRPLMKPPAAVRGGGKGLVA
jgi:hypothetical protein